MSESTTAQLDRWSFRLLLGAVTAGAIALLQAREWYVPPMAQTGFWNGVIAFGLLGIACDSAFLSVSRISGTRVGASVAFIPFIASVLLFPHPWPMIIAGLTGLIAHTVVRHKPLLRAWFNTAQYMLAVALGDLAYGALGGHVGSDRFEFNFLAFVALVLVFWAVNQGSVSLAVSLTSDISVRESWARIAGGSPLYDLVSSSLAI